MTLSLLVQVLSGSLIVLNYEVNQSYIIEKFCENTDKPQLKCDGKCHLAKQIKEDTDQKSETPASLSEIVTFVMTTHEVGTYEFNFLDSEVNLFNGLYLEGDYSNSLESLFRPPQV